MSRRADGQDFSGSADQQVWVLSREAVRDLDRLAVERYGIPSIVLMENAAVGLRKRALGMLDELRTRRVVILAGPGNNGGDGLALARHLHNAHCEVLVLTSGDPDSLRGDAAANFRIVRAMGLGLARLGTGAGAEAVEKGAMSPVLFIDALLGTGASDAPRGVIRDAILQLNRVRSPTARVLAVDVPSGLDCDSGAPAGGGEAMEADATVTFVALKPGFLRFGAQRWTGEVSVAGIGAPRELVAELGQSVRDSRRGPPGGEPGGGAAEDPPDAHARTLHG